MWLRTVEHRLQLVDEQQTHTIPKDTVARTHLARVLGFRDSPDLSALEGESFHKLPAAVYVRGFLVEYARALGLDSERVKQTYLARFRAARGPSADDEDEPRPKS